MNNDEIVEAGHRKGRRLLWIVVAGLVVVIAAIVITVLALTGGNKASMPANQSGMVIISIVRAGGPGSMSRSSAASSTATPSEETRMSPEEVKTRLAEIDLDTSTRSSAELDAVLIELNDLSSGVHRLEPGDLQATTARLDELRRRYTMWFNVAAAREAGQPPVAESVNAADPRPDPAAES